jgi:hypothetical protein
LTAELLTVSLANRDPRRQASMIQAFTGTTSRRVGLASRSPLRS